MKTNRCYLIGLLILSTTSLFAQDCVEYYNSTGCSLDRQRGYKIYSQSKSAPISVDDTIEFNIVFYGQKEYIFSLCTRQDFYPINFRLVDPDTHDVLYDNANDRYIESLGIGFDATRSLAILINVLADKTLASEQEDNVGCIGLLLQYRNYRHVQ
jgi:hypothetical protein